VALTAAQRRVCQLVARNREALGESYLAGGAALNELIRAPRISRDVDLFSDSEEALRSVFDLDVQLLTANGFAVTVTHDRRTHIQAEVSDGQQVVILEWGQDSAYRFFPLVEHPELGLTLHPFDLATNKVLAMVGRVEPRDWVDVISAAERLQPLGYLAWAACGKDLGFSPASILEYAARIHYSAVEVADLRFEGEPPDLGELARRWRVLLAEAAETVDLLPAEHAGRCVLNRAGELFRGDLPELRAAVARADLLFHEGALRGALPRLIDTRDA
jgi:hypothetical protein